MTILCDVFQVENWCVRIRIDRSRIRTLKVSPNVNVKSRVRELENSRHELAFCPLEYLFEIELEYSSIRISWISEIYELKF